MIDDNIVDLIKDSYEPLRKKFRWALSSMLDGDYAYIVNDFEIMGGDKFKMTLMSPINDKAADDVLNWIRSGEEGDYCLSLLDPIGEVVDETYIDNAKVVDCDYTGDEMKLFVTGKLGTIPFSVQQEALIKTRETDQVLSLNRNPCSEVFLNELIEVKPMEFPKGLLAYFESLDVDPISTSEEEDLSYVQNKLFDALKLPKEYFDPIIPGAHMQVFEIKEGDDISPILRRGVYRPYIPVMITKVVTGEKEDIKKHPLYGTKDTYKLIKCECGADKCGSGGHSDWCPKYRL